MDSNSILYPAFFERVRYDGRAWYFIENKSRTFLNPLRVFVPENFDWGKFDKLDFFGTSKAKLVMEFRLINGGKPGYYLANLRDRLYYYCGSEFEDVSKKLIELGIGR